MQFAPNKAGSPLFPPAAEGAEQGEQGGGPGDDVLALLQKAGGRVYGRQAILERGITRLKSAALRSKFGAGGGDGGIQLLAATYIRALSHRLQNHRTHR